MKWKTSLKVLQDFMVEGSEVVHYILCRSCSLRQTFINICSLVFFAVTDESLL